jgi:hypothetical protein
MLNVAPHDRYVCPRPTCRKPQVVVIADRGVAHCFACGWSRPYTDDGAPLLLERAAARPAGWPAVPRRAAPAADAQPLGRVAWWEAALAVVVILALLLGATLWEAARRGV